MTSPCWPTAATADSGRFEPPASLRVFPRDLQPCLSSLGCELTALRCSVGPRLGQASRHGQAPFWRHRSAGSLGSAPRARRMACVSESCRGCRYATYATSRYAAARPRAARKARRPRNRAPGLACQNLTAAVPTAAVAHRRRRLPAELCSSPCLPKPGQPPACWPPWSTCFRPWAPLSWRTCWSSAATTRWVLGACHRWPPPWSVASALTAALWPAQLHPAPASPPAQNVALEQLLQMTDGAKVAAPVPTAPAPLRTHQAVMATLLPGSSPPTAPAHLSVNQNHPPNAPANGALDLGGGGLQVCHGGAVLVQLGAAFCL